MAENRERYGNEIVDHGDPEIVLHHAHGLARKAEHGDDFRVFLARHIHDHARKTLLHAGVIEPRGELAQAFVERVGQAKGDLHLIGQFGIGFYSAFMVADKVTVETRKAGSQEAFVWESEGQGTYVTRPIPLEAPVTRATRGPAITSPCRLRPACPPRSRRRLRRCRTWSVASSRPSAAVRVRPASTSCASFSGKTKNCVPGWFKPNEI